VFNRFAVEFRVIRVVPIFDLEPVLPRRPCAVIRGPVIGQLERAQIEAERGFAKWFKAEINDCPVCRHREGFLLVAEIAAGRAMSPKDGAIRLQHGEARIVLCDQKPACWKRHEGRRSVIALGALCRYCTPCSVTGLVPGQDRANAGWILITTRKKRLPVRGPGDPHQFSVIEAFNGWSG
jgi:hypothetical protein